MSRLTRFLGLVALGWIFSWAVVGVYAGRPLIALQPGTPEPLRVTYLVLLYLSLVGTTVVCWRGWGPSSPGWSRPGWLLGGLLAGVVSAGLHRFLLWLGGWWSWPALPAAHFLLLALLTSLLLGVTEEAVFRGYLFGVAREEYPRAQALVGVSLFFALVHLFRPGGADFKLAFALGLLLTSWVLCRVVEVSGQVWPAAGLHSGWILMNVLDPPGRVVPGWISGLEGDPAAGALGWLLLLGLGFSLTLWSGDEPEPVRA